MEDHGPVLAAARRYLDRGAEDRPEDVATGPAFERDRQLERCKLSGSGSGATDIRSLVVAAVDGDGAEVVVDARFEPPMGRSDLSGPMQLRRQDGIWKVADHCIDRRRISASFLSLRGGDLSHETLTVRLAALDLGRRLTLGMLELANTTDVPLRIKRVFCRPRVVHSLGAQWRPQLAPGERATVLLAWKPFWVVARTLSVIAEIEPGHGRPLFVTWKVDRRAGTSEASVHDRRPLHLSGCRYSGASTCGRPDQTTLRRPTRELVALREPRTVRNASFGDSPRNSGFGPACGRNGHFQRRQEVFKIASCCRTSTEPGLAEARYMSSR
jgi:hypothetical protein